MKLTEVAILVTAAGTLINTLALLPFNIYRSCQARDNARESLGLLKKMDARNAERGKA